MTEPPNTTGGARSGWSIRRAAVLVAGLTAVSTLLGFLRDVVIGAVFGAGAELDAYLVAQGLMNLVLALAAGAMARAVVPTTAREASGEEGRCRGHLGFDVALTVAIAVLGLGAVVMALLSSEVTAVIAPGFDGAQAEMTASLTRIVLIGTVLIAGTNMLAALAQAHGRFAWSALEGVPFNIVMIGAAGLFGPRYGVTALAVGFVVGSAARLLLQLPPLRALGTRVRPRLRLRDPGFREIAGLVPALLVGTAVVNVNTMVDRAVGSTLAEGSITALSFAWRIIHLPEALVITALLVPLYPALGAAADDRQELRRLVGRGLSVAVTVLTPLCVGLAIVARPAVEVAFGRGAFDTEDVAATATALTWFAPALLALGCRQVIVRASYALRDGTAPVIVAVVAIVVNVVGDVTLAPVLGVAGIAVATTASLVVAALANGWLLHRRHRGIDPHATVVLLVRAAIAAAASGAVGVLVSAATEPAPALVEGGAVAGAVVAVHVLVLVLLRAPERRLPLELLRATLRR